MKALRKLLFSNLFLYSTAGFSSPSFLELMSPKSLGAGNSAGTIAFGESFSINLNFVQFQAYSDASCTSTIGSYFDHSEATAEFTPTNGSQYSIRGDDLYTFLTTTLAIFDPTAVHGFRITFFRSVGADGVVSTADDVAGKCPCMPVVCSSSTCTGSTVVTYTQGYPNCQAS